MAANTKNGDLVTFDVKVGGNVIPDELRVISVLVETGVNRIPTAKIVILDGESETGNFAASSSDTFVPGSQIIVEAGYDTNNQVIFQGIITGQSLRIDDIIGSTLELECRDEAIKMIVGRKCLTFSQQTDSDIISSIIGTYPGLTANVTSTSTAWPEQVQYYVTDWDYVLERAEMNGMIVTALNGKVSVAPPNAGTTSVFTVTYGDNILEFSADMDAVTQLGGVTASSWYYKSQSVSTAQSSNNVPGPGNITSQTLSEVVGLSSYQVQSTVPLEDADLTNWAQAQMIKSEYAKIRGEVLFQGNNLVNPANYITLKGLGTRFNGDHIVSAVKHDLSDGNWLTTASVGLSPSWFIEEPDVLAPPASGLLSGARGLFNGTVKQMYQDPDSQYRILVNIPVFDPNGAGIWARLANFYSTSGAGVFFLPEVGDEVVLGFLNEDPRYPVILGSMYSSSGNQPFNTLTPNQNNTLKAIVSKTGITIQFDDENKILTMITPDKNQVILSDKDKQITILDDNQNSIVMSGSGITMKSQYKITIQSDQQVSISGAQGVSVQASGGDVQISGVNIKETADSQYSAAGNSTAQINSGMELTLKSAMIMIN